MTLFSHQPLPQLLPLNPNVFSRKLVRLLYIFILVLLSHLLDNFMTAFSVGGSARRWRCTAFSFYIKVTQQLAFCHINTVLYYIYENNTVYRQNVILYHPCMTVSYFELFFCMCVWFRGCCCARWLQAWGPLFFGLSQEIGRNALCLRWKIR